MCVAGESVSLRVCDQLIIPPHTQTPSTPLQAKAALSRRLEQDRLLHGALSEGKEKQWEETRKGYERLLASMQVSEGVGREGEVFRLMYILMYVQDDFPSPPPQTHTYVCMCIHTHSLTPL